ncbi:MAG: ABC transporter permease [Paracoccaceae bacterium]
MTDALVLALAHIRFHAGRSLVVVLAAAIVIAVPLGVAMLVSAAEARLGARAEATPLVIGAKGGRLDLATAALHFGPGLPRPTTMAAHDAVWDSGLAEAVPLRLGFRAGGHPIVGTTLDYVAMRGLTIAEGRGLALLGEAVLGSAVAAARGLGPGDTLVSSPDTLFDLAGGRPLALDVVGVFAPTGTDDDRAVFVDIKTTWVIEGIGHGHDDVLAAADGAEVPPAAEYVAITPETIDGFHFHGDPAGFPVSAILARPYDARSATILRGRYLDPQASEQALVPAEVMADLAAKVGRMKGVVDAAVAAIGLSALLGLGLAGWLSVALRRDEVQTAFRLGAPRGHAVRLLVAEGAILLGAAGLLALLALAFARTLADDAAAALLRLSA